jgi:hypothetical protein
MPWYTRPEFVDQAVGLQQLDRLRAEGMIVPEHLSPAELTTLGRAVLGPPRYWLDPEQVPPPLTADQRKALNDELAADHLDPVGTMHRQVAELGCIGCWIGGIHKPCTRHQGQDPHQGEDHRQSTADQRQPAPEPLEPTTPEILRPEQAAGLEEGQAGSAEREQQRKPRVRNAKYGRSVSYLAPDEEDDPYSPFS